VANDIMPLYTGVVAATHALTGYRERNAYAVNLIVSALLMVVVFFSALSLFSSYSIAFLACFLVGFDPVLTKMTCLATKDMLFCLMALVTGLVLINSEKRWFYPALVVSTALLILSRRNGYWFILPLAAYLLAYGNGKTAASRITALLAVLGAVALVVSPWYLLVRDGQHNELLSVMAVARSSAGFADGAGPLSLVRGVLTWKTQVQVGLLSLIESSSFVAQLLLFVPLLFVVKPRRTIDLFWGSSLLVFLAIMSTRIADDTTLDFYYLPFFPVLLMYGSAGLVSLLDRVAKGRRTRVVLVAATAVLLVLPVSDSIRNHVHPLLRKKFDQHAQRADINQAIAWLNDHAAPGAVIAGNCAIRQYLYAISDRMIYLPFSAGDFSEEYFVRQKVRWVVIGPDNLREKDRSTFRPYLGQWWSVDDSGALREKALPPFLEPAAQFKNTTIYSVKDPVE
jgi:hypothetical protein